MEDDVDLVDGGARACKVSVMWCLNLSFYFCAMLGNTERNGEINRVAVRSCKCIRARQQYLCGNLPGGFRDRLGTARRLIHDRAPLKTHLKKLYTGSLLGRSSNGSR
jgi:hypothetical protein